MAQEAFLGYWGTLEGEKRQPARAARGNKGNLRVGELFCRPAQDRGGPVSCNRLLHVERNEVFGPCPGGTWFGEVESLILADRVSCQTLV